MKDEDRKSFKHAKHCSSYNLDHARNEIMVSEAANTLGNKLLFPTKGKANYKDKKAETGRKGIFKV